MIITDWISWWQIDCTIHIRRHFRLFVRFVRYENDEILMANFVIDLSLVFYHSFVDFIILTQTCWTVRLISWSIDPCSRMLDINGRLTDQYTVLTLSMLSHCIKKASLWHFADHRPRTRQITRDGLVRHNIPRKLRVVRGKNPRNSACTSQKVREICLVRGERLWFPFHFISFETS